MTSTRTLRRLAGLAVVAATTLAVTPAATSVAAPPADPSWTPAPPHRHPATLEDVAARGSTAWAVGSDLVDGFQDRRTLALRWQDGAWQVTPTPVRTNATLESVATVGRTGAWAVGEVETGDGTSKPLVLRWQGSRWQRVPGPRVPAGSFDDVAVGPGHTVWVTGYARVRGAEHAVVYRYAKGAWHSLSRGLGDSINGNALAVVDDQDAWLALNAGLAHYDGHRWVLADDVATDGSEIPTSVAVVGDDDVWAAGVHHGGQQGDQPLVLHYDGSGWDPVATTTSSGQLYDVAVDQGEPVFVGESFETTDDVTTALPLVMRPDGDQVVPVAAPTDAEGTLDAASVAGNRLWTVGLTTGRGYRPYAAYTDDRP